MGDGGRKAGLHSANNKEKQNLLMMNKTRKNMNLITNHIIKRYTETYLPLGVYCLRFRPGHLHVIDPGACLFIPLPPHRIFNHMTMDH
jgi:hypothetical protein